MTDFEINKEAAFEASKREKRSSLHWLSYFNGWADCLRMQRSKGRLVNESINPEFIINERLPEDNF